MAILQPTAVTAVTVINDDAALATARAAGDLTVAAKVSSSFCDAYLTLQFDNSAPSAGSIIAELYVLPGDGEASESFPQGGDAGLGTDVDPQKSLLVGVYETRSPSVSVNETLVIREIPLGIGTDRFVLKNISNQTYDSTWQLDVKCKSWQTTE